MIIGLPLAVQACLSVTVVCGPRGSQCYIDIIN